MRRLALSLLLLASCHVPPKKVLVHVEVPLDLASGAAELTVLPRIAEARRTTRRTTITLELKRESGKVRLDLPGTCPAVVDTRSLSAGAQVKLQPLFDVGPSERVVGLAQRFELLAAPSCPEAATARATFELAGGAALDDVRSRTGALAATTRARAPEHVTTPGIVPISARVAQSFRTTITFRVELANGRRLERQLGVAAAARSSGLPDVGLHHPVLLSGNWQLAEKPPESLAALRNVGTLLELSPDRAGRYRLHDEAGRKLSIQSGRFDHVPLDCGRAACHAEIAQSSLTSPMTQVLASDLGGCHTLSEPECASACHATGEPGVPDGGFSHVMAELGMTALPADYDDLPPALRRLGGVGCMACHGPARIPEPSARFAILKSDVCAVCHDAPPRYGHVQALRASRMGHADADPETRREPCARCHTTWGALGRTAPLEHDPGGGLACVTCHDVHPRGPGATPSEPPALSHPGLLRRLPSPWDSRSLPASLLGVSRVCVSCHAPSTGDAVPEASAVAILTGKGGLDPASGAALELPAPHTASPRGCLACHDSGPEALVMGRSHAFRATDAACSRCHQTPPPRDPELAPRARSLLARLAPQSAPTKGPWHALPTEPGPRSAATTRALRNVLLVLEDPAADVHHPSYARALLDAAAATLPP